jgi:hypothetical protein
MRRVKVGYMLYDDLQAAKERERHILEAL